MLDRFLRIYVYIWAALARAHAPHLACRCARRPSVVAAALLYAERRLRGTVPFWPSMLAKMSGYEDMASPELLVAVRIAQKLSRKAVYARVGWLALWQAWGGGQMWLYAGGR